METYSEQMLGAVRHDVQQASVCRLLDLLRYFRQRKGPGLARLDFIDDQSQARRRLNYSPPDFYA
jgi:hypothetical protein